MKRIKYILFTSVCLLIITSCFEFLPDISPDTADGKDMIVKTLNEPITFNHQQGNFERTQKFDINGDGIDDFWFVKVPFSMVIKYAEDDISTNVFEHILLAINGEYLSNIQPFIDKNYIIPNQLSNSPKILFENEIIGNFYIANVEWKQGGYKFTSNPYSGTVPGTYQHVVEYLTKNPNDLMGVNQRMPYSSQGYIFTHRIYDGYCLPYNETADVKDCIYSLSAYTGDNDDFTSFRDIYIPIRIPVNGKKHYGWIKINKNNLVSAAIATEPDKRVITGQVK